MLGASLMMMMMTYTGCITAASLRHCTKRTEIVLQVISTDMSKHMDHVANLRTRVEMQQLSPSFDNKIELTSHTDRVQVTLPCSTLSNLLSCVWHAYTPRHKIQAETLPGDVRSPAPRHPHGTFYQTHSKILLLLSLFKKQSKIPCFLVLKLNTSTSKLRTFSGSYYLELQKLGLRTCIFLRALCECCRACLKLNPMAVTRNLFRGYFLPSLPSLSLLPFLSPFLPFPLSFPSLEVAPQIHLRDLGSAVSLCTVGGERQLRSAYTFLWL